LDLSVILTDSEIDKLEEILKMKTTRMTTMRMMIAMIMKGQARTIMRINWKKTPRRMKRTKNKPDSYYNFDRKKRMHLLQFVCAFILLRMKIFSTQIK